MVHDVVIIGGGPAGLTAALYTARANLKPLVIEGKAPGGQLTTTTEVENFPGFPQGVQGPELVRLMREQAARFGATYITEDVTRVELAGTTRRVHTESTMVEAKVVILALGARAKMLGLPSEARLFGKGVSTCATCDGFFFRGKEVVVVGGGDSAMEEALFLARLVNKVIVIHRRDVLKASKIMQERAKANPKIAFLWNTGIEEVLGENNVTGLRIKNLFTSKEEEFTCQGMFLAIGHEPNTEFLKGQVQLDVKGYIMVKEGTTATNIPGVFACGDAVDHRYRQAITAAGTGCMAALDTERYLLGT